MATLPRSAAIVLLFAYCWVSVSLSLSVVSSIESRSSSSNCNFQAIYNFGDSNSDTGSVSAIYGPIPPPHGLGSFFHKPSGRWSDGRLMIDFIANELGFPFLSGYLDSVGANYRHGANFAMSGSTIELTIIDGRFIDAGFNQISCTNEIGQFEQFKNRTTNLYNQRGILSSLYRQILPNPIDGFLKAIYIIDIGQNDLSFWLTKTGESQTRTILPNLLKNFTLSIPRLYKQGARSFWIHNTGPIGCLPIYVNNKNYSRDGHNLDKIGCIRSFNSVAKEFNRLLKKQVTKLRESFSDAWFSYVDIYTARYSLTKKAVNYGFVNPLGFCAFNGTMCGDPERYISWDSIHFTEATNQWITNRTLSGRFCDPPVRITQACHWRHQ